MLKLKQHECNPIWRNCRRYRLALLLFVMVLMLLLLLVLLLFFFCCSMFFDVVGVADGVGVVVVCF